MNYFRVLVGVAWVNVIIIMWLQMLNIISTWPSIIYLIIFGVVGILGALIISGSETEPPTGTT